MPDLRTLKHRIRLNRFFTGVLVALLGGTFVVPDLLSVDGTRLLLYTGRVMIGATLLYQLFQLLFHTQMRDALIRQQEDAS